MESHASFSRACGRTAPKPFVLGALLVDGVSFLSQFLLAAPVMARANVVPFVAVQTTVAVARYVLHVRRLRDAGRSAAPAVPVGP